jgi:FixH
MNWGNKLLVTFLVFGAGMAFLVYKSVKTNYELVEKDYYKSELAYQQVIDGSARANALSATTVLQDDNGITLSLPAEMKNKKVSGTIHFYCAYDETKDKTIELNPSAAGIQVFSNTSLQAGDYTVKISWNADGTTYYTEKKLTVL